MAAWALAVVLLLVIVVYGRGAQADSKTREGQQAEMQRLINGMPRVVATTKRCRCGGECRCCPCPTLSVEPVK